METALAFAATVDGLSIGPFSHGVARGTNAKRLVELSWDAQTTAKRNKSAGTHLGGTAGVLSRA